MENFRGTFEAFNHVVAVQGNRYRSPPGKGTLMMRAMPSDACPMQARPRAFHPWFNPLFRDPRRVFMAIVAMFYRGICDDAERSPDVGTTCSTNLRHLPPVHRTDLDRCGNYPPNKLPSIAATASHAAHCISALNCWRLPCLFKCCDSRMTTSARHQRSTLSISRRTRYRIVMIESEKADERQCRDGKPSPG